MAACGSEPGNIGNIILDSGLTGDTATTDTSTTETGTDGGTGTDARTDGSTTTDARTDVAADAGPASPAGASCTMPDPMGGMDPVCGDSLVCIPTGSTPICTTQCENATSQAEERSMCGGTGSTCLTQGDGAQANSICTSSCRPTAMTTATGACRTGFVCTGWWYTHTGATPDSPGCFPFCSTNADCGSGAAGMVCNARRGNCGTAGPDMTRLPDGSPCNPMMTVMVPGSMTPQNVQCRGICFGVSSTDRTQGICGSFINTRVATGCPDDPDNVQPLARTGADNLAICIFRQCMTNSDCRSPHICRYDEQMGMPQTDGATFCNFPTAAQRTGIPGMSTDGGVTDGGSTTDASAGPG